MNEALNISPSSTFDAAYLSTMRRIRGDTPAANEDVGFRPAARELHDNARTARAQAIADIIAGALVSTYAALRRAYASYRAYRDARETMAMLRGLDDRTLHDLGYHRSEIESVAIEVSIARMR